MNSKSIRLLIALACVIVAVFLVGEFHLVRFKGVEGFEAATTLPTEARTLRDPYAGGGTAMASGGTHPGTRYGEGASLTATAPLDPTADQPAMGSGTQPGEGTVEAAPGFAHDNGPALQNPAVQADTTSTRSKQ